MAILSQFLKLPALTVRAASRVIVIDAGSHSIKVLLAEKTRRGVSVVRTELINLQEEKLLSAEEIKDALGPILRSIGDYPIALALPQNLPLSQILDMSAGSEGVKQLIEAETLKNRDLRGSTIVYDCARLQPFGKHQNCFWVTLCKEADIYDHIAKLALSSEDVSEVVSSGNVLALAYSKSESPSQNAVLIDVGASSSLVAFVIGGQLVHSTTIPIGGTLFTETIASKNNGLIEAAETLKRTDNVLLGSKAVPALALVVDGWRNEIVRSLSDWLRENPEINIPLSNFTFVVSGGGAAMPGFVEYLNRDNAARFAVWPSSTRVDEAPIAPQFIIAYGTALQAFGSEYGGSLLPAALRATWNSQRVQQRFLGATALFLVLTSLALMLGTWQKLALIRDRQDLLDQTTLALKKAEIISTSEDDLAQKYEYLRPVLQRQQQTLDVLNALAALERSRTNRDLWYVLIADQQSYFSGKTFGATNAPASVDRPPKEGFIAELCLKQEGEPMRNTLSQVVAELKQNSLFSNVDILPVDLRKNLANPKVLIPDRYFAIALELGESTFQNSPRAKLFSFIVPTTLSTTTKVPDEQRSLR